jgi:hypothetical protein
VDGDHIESDANPCRTPASVFILRSRGPNRDHVASPLREEPTFENAASRSWPVQSRASFRLSAVRVRSQFLVCSSGVMAVNKLLGQNVLLSFVTGAIIGRV